MRLLLGSAFLSYTKSTGEYDVAVIGTFFSLEFTEYLAPMCLYRVVTQVAQNYLLTGNLWLDSVTHPLCCMVLLHFLAHLKNCELIVCLLNLF